MLAAPRKTHSRVFLKPMGFLLFSIVFYCKYQKTYRFSATFNGFLLNIKVAGCEHGRTMLAAQPNAFFRPGKTHSRVFLKLMGFLLFSIVFYCKYQNTYRFPTIFIGFLL